MCLRLDEHRYDIGETEGNSLLNPAPSKELVLFPPYESDSRNLAPFIKTSISYHGFHIWIGKMLF